MDWDRVNRWLTLGANIGVLAGIILILTELNQNADLMRAQMSQSRADSLTARYADLMHSDYWPTILAKRNKAGSPDRWAASLTPEELERVKLYLYLEMNDLRNQYYQFKEGYLDESIWGTSSRGQIERLLPLLPYFLDRIQPLEAEFLQAINDVAREEGLPLIRDDGTLQSD